MCFIKPLRIKKFEGKTVLLENGVRAYYNKKIIKIKAGRKLKEGDLVLVYGNLIIDRAKF